MVYRLAVLCPIQPFPTVLIEVAFYEAALNAEAKRLGQITHTHTDTRNTHTNIQTDTHTLIHTTNVLALELRLRAQRISVNAFTLILMTE